MRAALQGITAQIAVCPVKTSLPTKNSLVPTAPLTPSNLPFVIAIATATSIRQAQSHAAAPAKIATPATPDGMAKPVVNPAKTQVLRTAQQRPSHPPFVQGASWQAATPVSQVGMVQPAKANA